MSYCKLPYPVYLRLVSLEFEVFSVFIVVMLLMVTVLFSLSLKKILLWQCRFLFFILAELLWYPQAYSHINDGDVQIQSSNFSQDTLKIYSLKNQYHFREYPTLGHGNPVDFRLLLLPVAG